MPDLIMPLNVPFKTIVTEKWYYYNPFETIPYDTETTVHYLAAGEILECKQTYERDSFGLFHLVYERFYSYTRKIAHITNTAIEVHIESDYVNGISPIGVIGINDYEGVYHGAGNGTFDTYGVSPTPPGVTSIRPDGHYNDYFNSLAGGLSDVPACPFDYSFTLACTGNPNERNDIAALPELFSWKITASKWEVIFRNASGIPDDKDCDGEPDGDGDGGSPPGDGGEADDASGYRAIECDSPRMYLHYANGKKVDTIHTSPGTSAFSGNAFTVDYWKQIRAQSKEGVLFGLGRVGSASKIFKSTDAGITFEAEELKSVNCYSGVMEYDSERRFLMLWTEATPPDPIPDGYQGAVSVYVSRDSGVTWDDPVTVQYDGADLACRLLGATYEPRNGGEVFLLVKISGDTKILNSTDGGLSFEKRFE